MLLIFLFSVFLLLLVIPGEGGSATLFEKEGLGEADVLLNLVKPVTLII